MRPIENLEARTRMPDDVDHTIAESHHLGLIRQVSMKSVNVHSIGENRM